MAFILKVVHTKAFGMIFLYFKPCSKLCIIVPNLIPYTGMMKDLIYFGLASKCIKIMDDNRVIRINTFFFIPQYENIIKFKFHQLREHRLVDFPMKLIKSSILTYFGY